MSRDTCDLQLLSSDPANPEASLRLYVQATAQLLTQASATDQGLKDACNAVNKELGLPTSGADATAACLTIATRIQTIYKNEPANPPGALATTSFVNVGFPATCVIPPGTLEGCISKCSAPCDTTKCAPEKLAGTCAGECTGTCTESGDNLPCNGSCIGTSPAGEGAVGGACTGVCTGTCPAMAWVGNCTAACPAAFTGVCGGICTGKCDGTPINVQPDAGADAEAGPPPTGPVQPPGGEGQNCKGRCEGVCSSGANGSCTAQCLTFAAPGEFGKFTSGYCGFGGSPAASCFGECTTAGGNGTTTPCSGTCTQLGKPACTGICRSGGADAGAGSACKGTLTNAFCEGDLACNQNTECNNACRATASLAGVCAEAKHSEIYTTTDPLLEAALLKNQGLLGKRFNELLQLRTAFDFVASRSLGDFTAIGLKGDIVRACVAKGRADSDAAGVKIAAASNANPFIRRAAK